MNVKHKMESLHKDNRPITSTCYQHAFTSRLGLPTGFTRGATRLNILQRNPFPLVKKGELKNHIVGFLFWRTFAKKHLGILTSIQLQSKGGYGRQSKLQTEVEKWGQFWGYWGGGIRPQFDNRRHQC